MPHLIQNDDLKRLFTGSAIAVAAGLLVGLSFKPSLADGLLAPQQNWGESAARTYAAADTGGVGAYGAQVPDYVVGTRWIQPQAPAAVEATAYAGDEEAELAAYDGAAPSADEYAATAEATHVTTRWQDQARLEPRYPSERGGDYHESDLPAPPAEDPSDQAPI